MTRAATITLVFMVAGPLCSVEAALARDEKRAERITADDDPVLIPVSMMPQSSEPAMLDTALLDPTTTGAIQRPAGEARRACNVLAWFPERRAEQQFRVTC